LATKTISPASARFVNPLNDIRIVGEALRAVGFEVLTPAQDVRRAKMVRALYEIAAKLKAAFGFIHYSGHALWVSREKLDVSTSAHGCGFGSKHLGTARSTFPLASRQV
jgi:uncharacterized caspase-like protein